MQNHSNAGFVKTTKTKLFDNLKAQHKKDGKRHEWKRVDKRQEQSNNVR